MASEPTRLEKDEFKMRHPAVYAKIALECGDIGRVGKMKGRGLASENKGMTAIAE